MAQLSKVVLRILNLPAFLLAVFIMYWSVPLCMLQNRIRPWKLRGSRNDAYGWGLGLQRLFGIRMRQMPGPTLYKGGPCIWLCNHRSWTDFFIDVVTTQGDSQMLSRMAVAFVFPMIIVSVMVIRSVILFKRGHIRDKELFNKMVERKMKLSPVNGLNVYPEGHRSCAMQSLPLRRGMMHFAYSRQLPVQVVMTANKEAVISEKDLSAHFGQTLLVGYSKTIHAKDFSDAESFFAAIASAWEGEWQRVYGADWTTSVSFKDAGVDYGVIYSPRIKALSMLSQGVSFACFMATVYYMCRLAAWALHQCGTAQSLVIVVLAVWFAASAWLATREVRPQPYSVKAAAETATGKNGGNGTVAGKLGVSSNGLRSTQRGVQ